MMAWLLRCLSIVLVGAISTRSIFCNRHIPCNSLDTHGLDYNSEIFWYRYNIVMCVIPIQTCYNTRYPEPGLIQLIPIK
jgi:hypothetical protein